MAPHSSTLAWKIPWTEKPGRLQSIGSLGVGHNSVTSLSLFTFMHGRRKWQPTPVFLPGELHGQRILVGYSLWCHRVRHDWSDLAAAAAVIVASAYKYRCSSVVESMRRFKQRTMIKPWEWMIYSYTQQQQCRSNLTNECEVEDPTWKKYTFGNFNYFHHL